MVKRVFAVLTCFFMLAMASGALAGGALAPAPAPMAPCAPAPCGPAMGNPCAFWGDAPFPGLCGGVVALPFLVVGSLLGGSTTGAPPAAMGPVPYGARPGMAQRVPVAPYGPVPCVLPLLLSAVQLLLGRPVCSVAYRAWNCVPVSSEVSLVWRVSEPIRNI